MNVLAFESSGHIGSIAACSDGKVLAEECLEKGLAHGRLLVPVMESVISAAEWDKHKDIELIAVSQGPGSFTGLRVGLAAAKTLAALLGCPIVGVCSLDAMAENAPAGESLILTALDAKRGQIYAAVYERDGAALRRTVGPCLSAPAEILAGLSKPVYVMGDAIERHVGAFDNADCRLAPHDEWRIKASTIARLGLLEYQGGRRDNAYAMEPIYLRLAEAEEKRLAMESKQH